MNPEDRLSDMLRADAARHQPGDGRASIAARLQARRRARRLRLAIIPVAGAVAAAAVALALVDLGSGPGLERVHAANRPGGSVPATLPATPTTAPAPASSVPTTARPSASTTTSASGPSAGAGGAGTPSTGAGTASGGGARVPAHWSLSSALDQGGSVYATADAPAAQDTNAGPAVVLRYPVGHPATAGATSAQLPGPLAVSEDSGRLWVLTGVQPYAASTGPSTLKELDPTNLAVVRSLPLVGPASSLDAAGGWVWVGLSSGSVERIDPASGAPTTVFPSPSGGTGPAQSLSLSPDGTLLYEMINQPLEVVQRNSSTGRVLHTASLGGPGGDTVLATAYGVWAHYATGMADSVEGFTAAGLSSYSSHGGGDFGESSERLGDAVVTKGSTVGTLYVWGYQRAGCYDAKSGSLAGSFALPVPTNGTPVTAGPDGMFELTAGGLQRVAVPAVCAAP